MCQNPALISAQEVRSKYGCVTVEVRISNYSVLFIVLVFYHKWFVIRKYVRIFAENSFMKTFDGEVYAEKG